MTKLSTHRGASIGCITAASLLFGAPAFDQAVNADSGQLVDIVVTAQRVATDLQKTPISVTAISGESLAQQGAATLLDVSLQTPNLSIASRPGQGAAETGYSIRGMGVNAGDSAASVGVYVDDVYFPSDFGNNLGLLDVERIEVLRGPQGTLFGRNTIAGAVQYVTVKPSQDFGGYVEVTGGNDGRADFLGALNLPITDTFAVRITGGSKLQGGYVTDELTHQKRGLVRNEIGRIQARWTPTDRLTIELKADINHEETNGRAVADLLVNPNAQFADLAEFSGVPPLNNSYLSTQHWTFAGFNGADYFKSRESVYSANIAYRVTDDVTFKSISAFTYNFNQIFTDLDLTPLPIFAGSQGLLHDQVLTQEFQLAGHSLQDRLKWTTGLYVYDGFKRATDGGFQLGLAGPMNPPIRMDGTKASTYSGALYGQATYNITEPLSATLGLRYTHEEAKGEDLTFNYDRINIFKDYSPMAGLNYQLNNDTLLYLKASKGFRAGGNTLAATLPGGGVGFAPETAWTYEIGARMEFLQRRLRVNPTVFYTDWKNIQFNYLVPVPAAHTIDTTTQNAGDAKLHGAELETEFAATERLLLKGSLSLLNGHYTSVNAAGLQLTTYPLGFGAALAGVPGSVVVIPNISLQSPLLQAPKYKYFLGEDYTQPLPNGSKVIGGLNWGFTANQSSAVTISDAIRMPAYGLLNGHVVFISPSGHWNLTLFGNNLLDKYYLIGGTGFGQGYTVGVNEGDPGRPREYGATAQYKF